MTNLTVSAIVPCFNEGKSVAGIIETLLACPEVAEVIVVNDGSTDTSAEVLHSFANRIKLLNFRTNHGKAAAVCSGIKQAQCNVLLLVDADLIGLKTNHIAKMLTCWQKKSPRVVLGNLFSKEDSSRDLFYYRLFDKMTKQLIKYDFLTGERLYYRDDLLPLLPKMKNLGYGLEVFLNHQFKNEKKSIVKLTGVFQPPKEQKNGLSYQTFRSYFKEAVEISKELARQQGVKGKEAISFRKKFIARFLEEYVSPGAKSKRLFQQYLDKILEGLYLR